MTAPSTFKQTCGAEQRGEGKGGKEIWKKKQYIISKNIPAQRAR